jgi:hypothetical protein
MLGDFIEVLTDPYHASDVIGSAAIVPEDTEFFKEIKGDSDGNGNRRTGKSSGHRSKGRGC